MRPPESFSSAAPKFLAKVSGTSLMVGVEIFIRNVLSCARAAPSVSISETAQTPATAAVRLKVRHAVLVITFPLPLPLFWLMRGDQFSIDVRGSPLHGQRQSGALRQSDLGCSEQHRRRTTGLLRRERNDDIEISPRATLATPSPQRGEGGVRGLGV